MVGWKKSPAGIFYICSLPNQETHLNQNSSTTSKPSFTIFETYYHQQWKISANLILVLKAYFIDSVIDTYWYTYPHGNTPMILSANRENCLKGKAFSNPGTETSTEQKLEMMCLFGNCWEYCFVSTEEKKKSYKIAKPFSS